MFLAHFANQLAFQNQQNLIALLVCFGSPPDEFPAVIVIIAVWHRSLVRRQTNLSPL
jgi:hypothetical protein